MSDYIITCDSTVDLSEELLQEKGIPYVSFNFEAEGKTYKDDYGKSYPVDKFYADIKNGIMFKTSQPNSEDYKALFTKFLEEGKDVLHISLSSGISGGFNSARIAANELNEKYGPQQVFVIDSLGASSGYGLLVIKAKDNQDGEMSLEGNINWLEENKKKIIHWFFSSDLSSFVRGGRISKAAGLVGAALQICPVMCVSDEGKLEVLEKTRTKKKAARKIVDNMLNEVGPNYSDYCYLCMSACLDDANMVANMIKESFPNIKEVKIFNIGGVIGSHTGPGTIALFYVGKKRAL